MLCTVNIASHLDGYALKHQGLSSVCRQQITDISSSSKVTDEITVKYRTLKYRF